MSIPGSLTPLFNSGAGGAAGYQIERSLRFNSADSAYLSRTPAVAGSRTTWTWAGWVKRSKIGNQRFSLFCAGNSGSDETEFFFQQSTGADTLVFYYYPGSYTGFCETLMLFRDTSAWYHIVLALDTTQGTAANRCKIYVNGVQQSTNFTSNFGPSATPHINSTAPHQLGRSPTNGYPYDGYLADIHFIDGQALDATAFTEVSATTGQLIPKAYTGGSYGTNGFYLQFADNSSNTATTLGKDTSGNSNNWTPNNFQATVQTGRLYGQASGTSTSAFSSANFLGNFPASALGLTIFDADLVTSVTSATFSYTYGFSAAVEVLVSADGTNWTSKGNQSSAYTTVTNATAFRYVRWFYSTFSFGITNNPAGNDSLVDTPTSFGTDTSVGGEVRGNYATWNPLQSSAATLTNGNLDCTTATATGGQVRATIAVSSGKWYWEVTVNTTVSANNIGIIKTSEALAADEPGYFAGGYSYGGSTGNKRNNASASAYGATYGSGDVIGVALDLTAGTLVFYKNGASQGTAFSSLTGEFIPCVGDGTGSNGLDMTTNFGQRAFAYTAPSGFKALCDTNLPAPLTAKPNTLMDAALYSGNNSTQTIPLSFEPDFIWLKCRNSARYHRLVDTVRGLPYQLFSNATDGGNTYDGTSYRSSIASVNSSGFVVDNTLSIDEYNTTGETYVAWAWDAGTSTVSNTAGSITSQVRANVSAGFSIVSYTGTGSTGTLGHGLGVKPQLLIVKSRSQARDWIVYHTSYGATQYTTLNGTGAAASTSSAWNNTEPTSTVFTIGNAAEINTNGSTNIAYCFAPVVGYSSFGSYTGNGSTDGPFIFTSFRPKFFMHKDYTAGGAGRNWLIWDAARETYNAEKTILFANDSGAESTNAEHAIDFVSNGIKIRNANANINPNGVGFVYMAFAENPFQYARAR